MTEITAAIPPWHSGTGLFNQPDATCELVLDKGKHSVSIVIWDGYCYLKLADEEGLWAITRPYNQTNLPEFVAQHIESGEVGRVWDFNYGPPFPHSFRSTTTGVLNDQTEFRLVAIVRSDNSAIVREWQGSPFAETPAFTKTSRQQPRTKAHVPSVWHPGRKLVEKSQIGFAAHRKIHLPTHDARLSIEELNAWKQGSFSELIALLQAFYLAAFNDNNKHRYPDFFGINWPLERNTMSVSGYLSYIEPKIDVLPLLRILWDHHHFDSSNWVPKNASYYNEEFGNLRRYWQKPEQKQELMIRRKVNPTTQERLEAVMLIRQWFKGKIDDNTIEKLLIEEK